MKIAPLEDLYNDKDELMFYKDKVYNVKSVKHPEPGDWYFIRKDESGVNNYMSLDWIQERFFIF